MEKINIEQIRTKYRSFMSTTMGSLERTGDDTESSLKILAKKINEIIDVLSDCEPKTPAKWVPRKWEQYYYLNDNGEVDTAIWVGQEVSNFRLKTKNVFKTKEEAEEAYNKIMNTNEGVV